MIWMCYFSIPIISTMYLETYVAWLPEIYERLYLNNRKRSPNNPCQYWGCFFFVIYSLGALLSQGKRESLSPCYQSHNKISLPFAKETICAFPCFDDSLFFPPSGVIVTVIQYKESPLGNQNAQALVKMGFFSATWLWTNHLTSPLLFLELIKRLLSPNHGTSLD